MYNYKISEQDKQYILRSVLYYLISGNKIFEYLQK